MNIIKRKKISYDYMEIVEEQWNMLKTMENKFLIHGVILEPYIKGTDYFNISFDLNKINENSLAVKYNLSGLKFESIYYYHHPVVKFLVDNKSISYDEELDNIVGITITIVFTLNTFIKIICSLINIEIYSYDINDIVDNISGIKEVSVILEELKQYKNIDTYTYIKCFKILEKNKNSNDIFFTTIKYIKSEFDKLCTLFNDNFKNCCMEKKKKLKEQKELFLVKIQEQKKLLKNFDKDEYLIQHNSCLGNTPKNEIIKNLYLEKEKEKQILTDLYKKMRFEEKNKSIEINCTLKKLKNSLLQLKNKGVDTYLNKEFLKNALHFEKIIFPEIFELSKDEIEKTEIIKILNKNYIYHAKILEDIIHKNGDLLFLIEEINSFIKNNINCYE